MAEPLISVIIPVYNHAHELELALASLKKQTYKNIEIIIEEDKLHEGAPVMRNRGFAKAKGEYVIFWDADVVGKPEMLEKMYQALQNKPEASFAYVDFKMQIGQGKMTKNIISKNFNYESLKQNNFIHSTSLVRRKDVVEWDENLKRFQDWDFWLTISEQDKIGVYIPETLFEIISQGTMSVWLPRIAYKKPWCWLPGIKKIVTNYNQAKKVIISKHHLDSSDD